MSIQTEDQNAASHMDELRAELDKLGEAEAAGLDDDSTDETLTVEAKPAAKEASATPAAGDDGKKDGAGAVEVPKEDKAKLVPYGALKEERTQKHVFKA